MSRYIDADELLELYDINLETDKQWTIPLEVVKQNIKDMPTADVVEVVRCKDCKHWLPHTQFGFDEDNDEYHDYCGCHMPLDDFEAEYWDANDYCNYGEKKE